MKTVLKKLFADLLLYKELAVTHKIEMNRWADMPDGTYVWYFDREAEVWQKTYNPNWFGDVVYIVDDEWAKLRMAYYDDELEAIMYGKWIHIPLTRSEPKWEYPINHWRRKPKFQQGEWVKDKKSDTVIRAYDNMVSDSFERWIPKRGELCVFWNDEDGNDVKFVIAKLSSFDNTQKNFKYTDMHAHCGRYKHCAPIEFTKEMANYNMRDRYKVFSVNVDTSGGLEQQEGGKDEH